MKQVINLHQRRRLSASNELAFLASFLDEDALKDKIKELAESVATTEEVEYLCIKQNQQAMKARL